MCRAIRGARLHSSSTTRFLGGPVQPIASEACCLLGNAVTFRRMPRPLAAALMKRIFLIDAKERAKVLLGLRPTSRFHVQDDHADRFAVTQ